MQIIMNQAEIEQAITAYVTSQITIEEGQEINIELKAGRGANGYEATLSIGTFAPTQEEAPEPIKPKQAKPKPVTALTKKPEPTSDPEPEEVEEAVEEEAVEETPDEDPVPDAPTAKPKSIFAKA